MTSAIRIGGRRKPDPGEAEARNLIPEQEAWSNGVWTLTSVSLSVEAGPVTRGHRVGDCLLVKEQ